jgi:hypothetical protein
MAKNTQLTQALGKEKAIRRVDIVRNILEEKGLNPFEGLAEICQERNADDTDYRYGPEIRVPCLKELASYVAPKLRSMEISAEGGGLNLGFQIIQFGDMANEGTRNNPRNGLSGQHGPVQQPVLKHGERPELKPEFSKEDHSSSEVRDSELKPEGKDN